MTSTSLIAPRSDRIKADLALLAVSVIWGSAFVAQRVAAIHSGVLYFNGLRFLLGALVLLPFALAARQERSRLKVMLSPGVILAGALLFGGAGLQQWGLRYTTAGNAGFITGLYVVLVPLILALVWRQRPRRVTWAASLLAAAGLYLLSAGGSLDLNPGDGLELGGALLWALHVILIGRLVRRTGVLTLAIGQYLVCGLLNLFAGLLLETNPATLQGLAASWAAILYTGILSVGLGYTLQVIGQRVAPPADAAILLSLEAVFAATFGWLLLGEQLALPQLLGCSLMLSAMLLAQGDSLRSQR